MKLNSFHWLLASAAFTLTLGLGGCNKALDVQPQAAINSSIGYTTKEDAAAGLVGCYDAVQAADYQGVGYSSMGELISGNILEVGTYNTTFGYIGQNLLAGDNVQIQNTWQVIYDGINRVNYLLQQSDNITDPAFPKLTTQAEARCLRAYNYMNLLGYWGGTTQGFGYPSGVGVPLRLLPVPSTTEATPIARASEADVVTAIRADLDFAIANLPVAASGGSVRCTKNAALALRARLELWLRNYADALKYAQQVPAVAGFASLSLASTTIPDAIWQLSFSNTDQNLYAFYWYPSPGGRNEFDPGPALIAAHPAGDKRLPINNNLTPAGTTLKYTHTATRDDYFSCVRYAEVVLTTAEAAAQTGDLITATAQLNIIRSRAGLAPSTATTAADLVTDILLQRRLELAYEGQYWMDLRRTNTVQTTLPTYTQTFRNLFPLPTREVNITGGIIVQNTGF
ncbi:RagB/SusD family nutrient uptake outer membrane protein [Hymenobacter psoromatis]|uniref:RagB/SusD family nutrient uptake outer membrane protein n=1 Tax=Hymenobacter psoromatis TaxID=1484116 RepID=UPI001CBFE004|nr:RagB/SusD family nutrient uptake outer membrane protein [Hymenobacter psoromatis]